MESNTTQQLQQKAREVQAKVAPQIDQARRNLDAWNTRATTFIGERPGTCLAAALALGFLIGKLANRR
jgi:ElaB/YqjD/DUF883 family membrane-anchored ribosome-binding protein